MAGRWARDTAFDGMIDLGDLTQSVLSPIVRFVKLSPQTSTRVNSKVIWSVLILGSDFLMNRYYHSPLSQMPLVQVDVLLSKERRP